MAKSIEEPLEALVQATELLAGMQTKTEENLQRLEKSVDRLTGEVDRLAVTVDRGFGQVARILVNHEERLDRLDQQNER
jgi:hypothetical protein